MERNLKQVNEWAMKSCPKWNPNVFSRRKYRKKYREAAQECWESPEWQRLIRDYKAGQRQLNTYPWPYADPKFADWEEDDSRKGYNLISDQSGCVIKHSTSYCAWKIFEATGQWPQKLTDQRLDAKNWQRFLAEAGYPKVVERLSRNHCYVGIKPDEGEFGLVVWAESIELAIGGVNVSTYVDRQYKFMTVDSRLYTWVEIS